MRMTEFARGRRPISTILRNVNARFFDSTLPEQSATIFLARYDERDIRRVDDGFQEDTEGLLRPQAAGEHEYVPAEPELAPQHPGQVAACHFPLPDEAVIDEPGR